MGMVIMGLGMFGASMATFALGGPRIVAVIFLVLMVLCPAAGYPYMLAGVRKSREENEQLLAKAEARQKKRGGAS